MKYAVIPNFSRYLATENGDLISTNYKNSGQEKKLKPSITGGYYKTMLLRDDGKYVSKNVHWFITLAFFGERKKGLSVNHKDGNKLNNHIDNLEYVTESENRLHAYKMGLQKPKKGSLNGNSKLTEKEVKEIREAAKGKRYYGRKKLAEKYGVSECAIKEIVNRRKNIWAHV